METTGLRFGFIGVGQCGGNIANEFAKLGYKAVAINTSSTDLIKLEAIQKTNKLLINVGLQGAGKNPELGRQALEEHVMEVMNLIELVFPSNEVDTLFVCAGLGGGTGSGISPLLSQILIEQGYSVCSILTLPSDSESSKTKIASLSAFEEISQIEGIGSCFVIDNAKASTILKDVGLRTKYNKINEHISVKLDDVNKLTVVPTDIAFDMRDFETLLSSRGSALITSVAIGDIDEIKESQTLAQYVDRALEFSIFADVTMEQVKGCAFLFEMPEGGGQLLTEDAIAKMQQRVGNPFEVFYGIFESKNRKREIKLTIVLTGLPFPFERLQGMQQELENSADKLQQIFETSKTQKYVGNSKSLLNQFVTNSSKPSTPANSSSSTLSKLLEKKKK